MTNELKKKCARFIGDNIKAKKLSQNKWATMAGVSTATVSNVLAGKWDGLSPKMWNKLAAYVGLNTSGWNMAETADYMRIGTWLDVAQKNGITIAMAGEAGSGKTAAMRTYSSKTKDVYYLECSEHWTQKLFMQKLYQSLGLDPEDFTAVLLAERIISELRKKDQPLVILDEFDKLKDSQMLFFITLYNELDGVCGFFISGAPYLERYVERCAKRNKRGFREIYSRMGQRFLPVLGVQKKDIDKVCKANGVHDQLDINAVFNGSGGDLRRAKREIERIMLKEVKAAS